MGSHVSQQDKTASEFFIADCALKRLFSGVIPYVVIENVSSVERFSTVGAFEFPARPMTMTGPQVDEVLVGAMQV